MAFTRPAVHVYQQYVTDTVSTISPFFELCVVGPSYLVQRDVHVYDKIVTPGGDYAAGAALSTTYPNIVIGANVDIPFTESYLKNTYVKVWPSYVQGGSDVLNQQINVANDENVTKLVIPTGTPAIGSFTGASVAIGDSVSVTVGTNTYTATIKAVIDANTLYLSKNVPTPVGTTGNTFQGNVTITRPIATNVTLPVNPAQVGSIINGLNATSAGMYLPAELTTTVNNVVYRVISGQLYITYRALRAYLATDFTSISTQAEADAALGTIDVANPLSVAVSLIFANASVPFNVIGIGSDDNTGYLKALQLLSTSSSVYVIVPLTQDTTTIEAYAAHMTAMSDPLKSKWRIMYANIAMPSTSLIIDQNTGELQKTASDSVAYISDTSNGMFNTNGAAVGDYINVYDFATNTYKYSVQILGILNDSIVQVSTQTYTLDLEGFETNIGTNAILPSTIALNTITYSVVRSLSAHGIAQAMVDIANSYSNSRVRLVEPDEVIVTVNSVDETLPGYYLCVVFGAMRAGFPPHQGFTTLGISGIKQLLRSNKYFNDDDLNLMAGGGIFVTVQDQVSAQPYCIYQTTTNTTTLAVREDSVVATVDFASMYYRDNLKAVLGKFNVNSISTDYVSSIIKDVTSKMMRMTYPYIGPILISGSLVSMTTNVDKILPVISIQVPFPVNEVDVYLQI